MDQIGLALNQKAQLHIAEKLCKNLIIFQALVNCLELCCLLVCRSWLFHEDDLSLEVNVEMQMNYLPCFDIDCKTLAFFLYPYSTYVMRFFAPYFTFTC